MANKLTDQKIDEMWSAYLEKQSAHYVSQKCQVSRKTVARYRRIGDWDERVKKSMRRRKKRQMKVNQKEERDTLTRLGLYSKKVVSICMNTI
jgi:hypothetical protein